MVLGVTVLSGALSRGTTLAARTTISHSWLDADPEEIWDASLGVRNFFENTATVHLITSVGTTTGVSVGALCLQLDVPLL